MTIYLNTVIYLSLFALVKKYVWLSLEENILWQEAESNIIGLKEKKRM